VVGGTVSFHLTGPATAPWRYTPNPMTLSSLERVRGHAYHQQHYYRKAPTDLALRMNKDCIAQGEVRDVNTMVLAFTACPVC
jgi:hypothetical protein